MTKAERTIGTPGFEQAPDEPVEGRTGDGPAEHGGPAPAAEAGDAAATPEPPEIPEASGEPGTGAADGSAAEPAVPDRGKRKILVLFGVAALAYLLDIVSKTLVVRHLEHHPSIQLIGQYLQLEAVRNSGAAFGIGQGMTIVFTLIALVVIGVIARLSRKLYSVPWAIALGLLLGGALGNLTDRIFRSPGVFRGAVVDFIAPQDFAVFNLADSAIVCGGVLIVWLSFRGLDPDGSVHRD